MGPPEPGDGEDAGGDDPSDDDSDVGDDPTGGSDGDCSAAATYYLEHRLARLDQVRQARQAGAVDAADVVRMVYTDVDQSLWPAAEWSVRAQLAYLDHEESSRSDSDQPDRKPDGEMTP